MGHEAIGIVEDVGRDVQIIKRGQIVIMPFAYSEALAFFCYDGLHASCLHVGSFAIMNPGGAQAEALRIPQADGTLFPIAVEKMMR